MNELTEIILLSFLVGAVVAGFVWTGWGLTIKLGELAAKARLAARKKNDAAALLDQSKAREPGER